MNKRKLELEVSKAKVYANVKELEFKKLLKLEDIERINEHIKLQNKQLKEIDDALTKEGE